MLTPKKVAALLVGALVLALIASNQAQAFTETENLGYIAKILGQLNNKEKCEFPTYEEIDDLEKSFNELKSLWGNQFVAKLSADLELASITVLDQWSSFQRYLTGAAVTASAKNRAFLGRVESYQLGKYGFSICTQNPDDRAQKNDGKYEKNPLVRYVKQLRNDGPAVDGSETTTEDSKKGTNGVEANSQGGTNGNDPFADEPDVVFKFKVHPDNSNQNVRQYGGKFTYRDGRTPHRITLNIHKQ